MKNSFKGKEVEKKQKFLFSLMKEKDELFSRRAKMPLIELPKPVFAYYELSWVLSEKALNSKYAKDYQLIIDRYFTPSKTRTAKKAKELEPPAIKLSKGAMTSLCERAPDAIRWFSKNKEREKYTGSITIVFHFMKSDLLIKKINKVFYTHRRQIDPIIEKRIAEIDKEISYDGNYKNSLLLDKYLGHHYKSDYRAEGKMRKEKADKIYYEGIIKEEVND